MEKKVIFQEAWRWEKEIEDFFCERIKDQYSLHICCGESKLGSVRIDLDPKDNEIQKADMRDLPFKNCTFDIVFGDLPWKLNYYQRQVPFFEMVRVCIVGGEIYHHGLWIPKSKATQLRHIWVKAKHVWTNASVISWFVKTTNEYDNYKELKL